jgi:hypothetical protein
VQERGSLSASLFQKRVEGSTSPDRRDSNKISPTRRPSTRAIARRRSSWFPPIPPKAIGEGKLLENPRIRPELGRLGFQTNPNHSNQSTRGRSSVGLPYRRGRDQPKPGWRDGSFPSATAAAEEDGALPMRARVNWGVEERGGREGARPRCEAAGPPQTRQTGEPTGTQV